MADETTILNLDEDTEVEQEGQASGNQQLLLAQDVLPEALLIIPLFDRPMFPKMMGPIMVEDPRIQKTILEAQQQGLPNLSGAASGQARRIRNCQHPEAMEDFFSVGVAAKVVADFAARHDQPLQLVAQAQERFSVKKLIREKPVFRALVSYPFEGIPESTDELKAYSVAIIDCIKELVTLNPLFKEGLDLLLERINVSDPSALADFAASMTTSSGAELQVILETSGAEAPGEVSDPAEERNRNLEAQGRYLETNRRAAVQTAA